MAEFPDQRLDYVCCSIYQRIDPTELPHQIDTRELLDVDFNHDTFILPETLRNFLNGYADNSSYVCTLYGYNFSASPDTPPILIKKMNGVVSEVLNREDVRFNG